MSNRIHFLTSQPEPLDWLAKNLDSTNQFILSQLRRGNGDEQRLLTQFFAVLRAKRVVCDGLLALRELEAVK